jgi:hypothetical protein
MALARIPVHSQFMKTISMPGVLGAGIFVSGSETIIVDRRQSRGNGDDDHTGRRDAPYRDGINGTHYRTRNIVQASASENNVYETNRHRKNVNRTVMESRSQAELTAPLILTYMARVHRSPSTRIQCKADEQRVNIKHEGDAWA